MVYQESIEELMYAEAEQTEKQIAKMIDELEIAKDMTEWMRERATIAHVAY